MSEQYDEHEQSEQTKRWLMKNGSNILTAILLAISTVMAWQWWQGKQLSKEQASGNQYQEFVKAISKNESKKAIAYGQAIIANDKKSDFAFLAALRLAKLQHEQGKLDLSMQALDKASAVANSDLNRELVQIRKAQLLQSQQKWTDAEKAINVIKTDYFPGTVADIKGDIAAALKQPEKAAKFYQTALLKLDASAGSRTLIEMKLTEAGGTANKSLEIN